MMDKRRKANALKRLASQLEQDLETALTLAKKVKEFACNVNENEKANEKNPNIYAVALSLQHYYTSLETAFKRVAKEIDGDIPDGGQWHHELLAQMSVKIPDIRPILLSNELKKKLDKLRRFRHVVRHGYEYELDWSQIKPLVDSIDEINFELKESINEFNDFLLSLADEIEK